MIILPCIEWMISNSTYLVYVLLLSFVFGLFYRLMGGRSR